MIKRIRLILLILITFINASGRAQQLPLYSQYMMNGYLLNPAIAGFEGYTEINLTAREQWIGLANAPKTHALSAQTRISNNSFLFKNAFFKKLIRRETTRGRVGLGGYIYNDKNGPIDRTGLQLTYTYHINISESLLSFGLSGTLFQLGVNMDDAVVDEEFDRLLGQASGKLFVPDANFGVHYINSNYYAGLSIAQLLQSSLQFGKAGYDDYKIHRHYFLTGGYIYKINEDFVIEPSILLKATEVPGFQMDINSKVYYKNDYWGGISVRAGGGAIILMGGARVDKFYFGYALDISLSPIRQHSYGSHEFMIAMKIGEKAGTYKWLNRY